MVMVADRAKTLVKMFCTLMVMAWQQVLLQLLLQWTGVICKEHLIYMNTSVLLIEPNVEKQISILFP